MLDLELSSVSTIDGKGTERESLTGEGRIEWLVAKTAGVRCSVKMTVRCAWGVGHPMKGHEAS